MIIPSLFFGAFVGAVVLYALYVSDQHEDYWRDFGEEIQDMSYPRFE